MNKLFSPTVIAADVPPVPGLGYLPGYVTEADELALVAIAIASIATSAGSRRSSAWLKLRRSRSFVSLVCHDRW